MGVFEFILGILTLIVIFILGLGVICYRYDYKAMEKENEKLREDLKKARARKVEKEYEELGKVK